MAQFISVFPGHYTGRATHIHVMVHQTDGTLQSNGTYVNSTASHVGQVFFDQDLITQVDALAPYNSNTQTVTENSEDMILESVWDTFDPMMSYALIGDSLADGILAWSTIVINVTESSNVGAAAHYYETGGVAEDSGIGGGSGGSVEMGNGNGTAPSGLPGTSGSPNASGSAGANASANGSGSTTATRIASTGAVSASASSGAAIKGRHLPGESTLTVYTHPRLDCVNADIQRCSPGSHKPRYGVCHMSTVEVCQSVRRLDPSGEWPRYTTATFSHRTESGLMPM